MQLFNVSQALHCKALQAVLFVMFGSLCTFKILYIPCIVMVTDTKLTEKQSQTLIA